MRLSKRCFDASSIESLKGEATDGPLAICVCGGNGADVGTRVDHEVFSGVTLMNVTHAASSTTPQLVKIPQIFRNRFAKFAG